jgi:hypothetical protein
MIQQNEKLATRRNFHFKLGNKKALHQETDFTRNLFSAY